MGGGGGGREGGGRWREQGRDKKNSQVKQYLIMRLLPFAYEN